jgi:hypothetical protein
MMQQMIQQQAHTGPKRYALVDDTGRVMGICHWDGHTKLDFPGLILVRSDSAQVGWMYFDLEFKKPGRT